MRTILKFAAVLTTTCLLAGPASADSLGRYDCTVTGSNNQEPIGDRPDHVLVNFSFACVGVSGVLKGAVYTGNTVSEWEGDKGKYLYVTGIHRAPGSLAVTLIDNGSGMLEMKDGKLAGSSSTGKGVFKYATGVLKPLSGKTFTFASRATAYHRFSLELND